MMMLSSRSRCPSVKEKNNHTYALNLCTPESFPSIQIEGGGRFSDGGGSKSPPNITVAGRASPKKVESLIDEGIQTNDGSKWGPASHRSLHYMG